MEELVAARAWRDAQAEADAALARAADINQGCEPGSKRGAHREATQAEQRAREARDRYDAVRGAVSTPYTALRHIFPMTPTRFRECLDILGWTQRGLATYLDAPEGMIRSMARGTASIPDELAAWLEARAQHAAATPPPTFLRPEGGDAR